MVLKIYRVDIDYLNSSKKWKAMYEQEGIEGRNFCEKKANNSRGMSWDKDVLAKTIDQLKLDSKNNSWHNYQEVTWHDKAPLKNLNCDFTNCINPHNVDEAIK